MALSKQIKISIITVVYNAESYLESCIQSVLSQNYSNIEYIIIDGASTDGTLQIIDQYKSKISHFVSEPDKGLYDAINKGISLATGEVVGILNADDYFPDVDVVSAIAEVFNSNLELDGLYGNLNYIHPQNHVIVRKWRSRDTTFKDIESGWMPAHPTLYLKRELFSKWGNYALDMGTAADYDLILRYFHTHKINTIFLDKLMVNMRLGGVSNQSYQAVYKAILSDYKALKRNQVPAAPIVLIKKKLSKITQFL